jgi:hypothetical protein
MESASKLVAAFASLLWPIIIIILVYTFRNQICSLVEKVSSSIEKSGLNLEFLGFKTEIKPAQLIVQAQAGAAEQLYLVAETRSKPTGKLPPIPLNKPLPADYIYLNHISFLRPDRQQEFRQRTGYMDLDHYDIRVVLDSYYEEALWRVHTVEYILHEGYHKRKRQARFDHADHFMLKELANGEFVLLAKVWLRDKQLPFLLQRYISLEKIVESDWKAWMTRMGSKPHV